MIDRRRALGVLLTTLLVLLLVPVFAHGDAGAQTTSTTSCSYPFDNCSTTSTPSTTPGNTTTTKKGGGPPTTKPGKGQGGPPTSKPGKGPPFKPLTLGLDRSEGGPGSVVQATVCNAEPGSSVRLTFNGVPVASAPAGSGSCPTSSALGSRGRSAPVLAAAGPLAAALSHASVRAQSGDGVARASFTVPDVGPGRYLVCAESAGSTSGCTSFTVRSGADVLGTTFGRGGGAPLISSGNGDSFLAFSGLGLLRMLLLGGLLVGGGYVLVRRGQLRYA